MLNAIFIEHVCHPQNHEIINHESVGRTNLHMYMYVQYLKETQQKQEILKISKEI